MKKFSRTLEYVVGVACAMLVLMSAFSCNASRKTDAAIKNLASSGKYDKMYYMTAWQLSAEGQGVMMQAFNSAKMRIKEIVSMANDSKNKEWEYKDIDGTKVLFHNGKRAAIVSDIDDTLVNGSNYAAKIVGLGGDWNNAAFARFAASANCTALPGSVDFVTFCQQSGIDFYFLTNRYDQGYKIGQSDSVSSYEETIKKDGKGAYISKDGKEIGSSVYQVMGKSFYDITLESLTALGFNVNDKNLIINDSKLNGSSKEPVRQAIRTGNPSFPTGVRANENATGSAEFMNIEPHDIIMLVGDQTTDFTDELTPSSNMDAVKRAELATKYADKWGTEWILLPNGVYGTSQDGVIKYGYNGEPGYESVFKYYSELNL